MQKPFLSLPFLRLFFFFFFYSSFPSSSPLLLLLSPCYSSPTTARRLHCIAARPATPTELRRRPSPLGPTSIQPLSPGRLFSCEQQAHRCVCRGSALPSHCLLAILLRLAARNVIVPPPIAVGSTIVAAALLFSSSPISAHPRLRLDNRSSAPPSWLPLLPHHHSFFPLPCRRSYYRRRCYSHHCTAPCPGRATHPSQPPPWPIASAVAKLVAVTTQLARVPGCSPTACLASPLPSLAVSPARSLVAVATHLAARQLLAQLTCCPTRPLVGHLPVAVARPSLS